MKRLSDFREKYPQIRLATQADNEEILEFLRGITMKTKAMDLRYERAPDFFALFKEQSYKYYVWALENEDGSIGGVGAMSIRRCWHNGKPANVLYGSDVRISPTLWKNTKMQWKEMYIDVMNTYKEIEEFSHVDYFNAAILDQNKPAIRTFTKKDSIVYYNPIKSYKTVSLLGKFPFSNSKPSKTFVIRFAEKSDEEQLNTFLYKAHKNKALGYFFTENSRDQNGEWYKRLRDWDGVKIKNYIIAKYDNEIVACCLPYSTSKSRRMMVDDASKTSRLLGQAVRVFGSRPLKMHDELKMLSLSGLEFESALNPDDKREILNAFLHEIYSRKMHKDYNMVSFLEFEGEDLSSDLNKKYLLQKTPATIFQAIHRDEKEEKGIIKLREGEFPGFELAMS